MSGHYSIKRFSLQIVRFFAFSLQATRYGLVFGWRDAIFLQGLIGAVGVLGVIVASVFGLIKGTAARRLSRAQAHAA